MVKTGLGSLSSIVTCLCLVVCLQCAAFLVHPFFKVKCSLLASDLLSTHVVATTTVVCIIHVLMNPFFIVGMVLFKTSTSQIAC